MKRKTIIVICVIAAVAVVAVFVLHKRVSEERAAGAGGASSQSPPQQAGEGEARERIRAAADYRDLVDFFLSFDLAPRRSVRFSPVGVASESSFLKSLPEGSRVTGREKLWHEYVEAAVSGDLRLHRASVQPKKAARLSILRGLFDSRIRKAYLRTRDLCGVSTSLPDTMLQNFGMCLPGTERLFVTAAGSFLPCERLPSLAQDLIIGHVDSGFDEDTVIRLCETSAAMLQEQCVECWNIRNCVIPCDALIDTRGSLSKEAKSLCCEQARQEMHDSLVSLSSVLEENPNAFEYMHV